MSFGYVMSWFRLYSIKSFLSLFRSFDIMLKLKSVMISRIFAIHYGNVFHHAINAGYEMQCAWGTDY